MADFNPYKAPTAKVEVEESDLDVPTEIMSKIKGAWIAGLVSMAFTLAFIAWSFFGEAIMGINAWAFVDVALMGALVFGVYRKSRTCAILLLAFYTLNKIVMWVEAGAPTGAIMSVIFFWFFLQGVIGTFQFHRWKNERDAQA